MVSIQLMVQSPKPFYCLLQFPSVTLSVGWRHTPATIPELSDVDNMLGSWCKLLSLAQDYIPRLKLFCRFKKCSYACFSF